VTKIIFLRNFNGVIPKGPQIQEMYENRAIFGQ